MNETKLKKFFMRWTIFELILLVFSPIAVLVVGICFHSDALTIATSIVGILCALFLAKGWVAGQFFGIAIVILYSWLSFNNAFYGEMIIYIAIMLPMYIWGIVGWSKHKSQKTETVEVNTIKWQEWLSVICVAVMAFVGFYFLLRALNTNELIVSTLSVIDNIFAVYLLARRSKYGFVSYVVNDIILIVLWGIPIINGNFLVFPMFLNPVINLVNDLYGVVNWTKLQQKQGKGVMDANYEICLAEEKDLVQCAEILRGIYNNNVLNEGWTKKSSNAICKFFFNLQPDLFFVAKESGGGILGFTFSYIKPWADGNQLMIEEISVKEEFRGQKIASNLLKTLISTAKKKYKVTQVNGTTYRGENGMPYSWYERINFTKVDDLFLIEGKTDEVLDRLK